MERHRLTDSDRDPARPGTSSAVLAGDPGAFAADDGSAAPPVVAVLQRYRQGVAGRAEVVSVLADHRLLVPLLEVDAAVLEGEDSDPCAGQDRAVAAVSLRTPAGVVGLAFTGLEALRAWDPAARPLPVPARRVAAALLAESAVALQLDPSGPVPLRLEPVGLARLATGEAWPLPWRDPVVQDAVVAALSPALAAGELAVRLAAPDPGADAGLLVELRFPVGVTDTVALERAGLVARLLSESPQLRGAFDGVLAVRLG